MGVSLRADGGDVEVARSITERRISELRPGSVDPKSARFRFLDDAAVEQLPPLEFLVDGLIPRHSLVEMHGPPGSGKSFLALDLALSIASGRPFCFRSVKRGPVIYIAAEGSAGIAQRLRAWKHNRALTGAAGVLFVTQPLPLLDPGAIAQFADEAKAKIGNEIQLLVVDTLARCFAGGDENSSRDMGAAIDAMDMLRLTLGCTVLAQHHTRKDGDTERGSTALRGAVDTMLSVRKDDNDLLSVICEKQKDAAPFQPIQLRLEPALESCVVTARASLQYRSTGLTSMQRQALESLQSFAADEGASTSIWLKASGIKDRSFYNVRSELITKGYVRSVKRGRASWNSITAQGDTALTANCTDTANSTAMQFSEHSDAILHAAPPPLGGGSDCSSQSSNTSEHVEFEEETL